ncbi:TATA element modulatory factor 1 TATA binding-domain-containing protein [Aspergillus cavernicola]|uniref:TATA element modulatory factor 1 TATA binding-domain-containing protein n=1 Tax=Aspergillus cavernicola TaxID=176166 RepID=A0ABR4IWN3_9EURO
MAQNRWKVGSFLQQAVAGVESRLDQMLTEEEDAKRQQLKQTAARPKSTDQSGNVSRSSSNARKNDRLQERLARAMVKPNAQGNTSPSSPAGISPVTSPVPSNGARSSMDIDSNLGSLPRDLSSPPDSDPDIPVVAASRTSDDSSHLLRNSTEVVVQTSREDDDPNSTPPPESSTEEAETTSVSTDAPIATDLRIESANTPPNDEETADGPLQAEKDVAGTQIQEEIHGYIERIDALQSKLKYLAQEAAESARNAATTADPGSVDRQLREKDEKIALLLQEGQKLSKTEMDHRTLIRKLRQQLADNSKVQTEAKKKNDRLERDLANAEARSKRAEAAEKRANGSLSAQTKTARDLEAVTAERNALSQTVQEIKGQLARAVSRADAAETKANSDALEREKHRADQLEEDLSSARIEREIVEEKLRREMNGLKENIEQEKERARVLESELKGEQSVLESKMESLRSRAEEASSGVAGDTQVKLLRQIETLQTQYAVASENWQALESSLLSRLANVEKDRDDVARREGEARRKIRDTNFKVKRHEEELENAQESQRELSHTLDERSQELRKAEQRLKKAADELSAAQNEMTEQKTICDATWMQKLEDERAKWREQAVRPNPLRRTESPVSFHRPSNLDIISMSDYRPTSRRASAIPGASPEIGTPPRQNSLPVSTSQAIMSPPPINGSIPPVPETPNILFESDEFFSGSGTPSAFGGAPTHPRGINDIISESTVGAGPSVQLVERMSATVRRLESERAASKDELARITTQRDEARQQVVDLMREVEEKRTSDTRVQEMEQKLHEIDQRYETTLEMLGEKSEQVEELQADIADLKKIYRELVDSTMK